VERGKRNLPLFYAHPLDTIKPIYYLLHINLKHKTDMKNKEEIIVFQNQSHLVQKHFDTCGVCPSLLDICLATDLMIKFATEGYSKELKTRFDNFEKYMEEKKAEQK
jgi:hypothetical protein